MPIGVVALFVIAMRPPHPAPADRARDRLSGDCASGSSGHSHHPAHHLGRDDLRLGVRADHLASGGRGRSRRSVLLGRGTRRRTAHSARALPEPVFTVSSSVGFIVGFMMFGAIIYIPLYLQTVHSATPTSSGLQLLPLVCGMLVTFTISGRLVTKWGRYKIFPVFGTAVMSVGLFLLSLLTPYDLVGRLIGLHVRPRPRHRLVMQVLVVAVQNAVPHSQLGTATSSSTFFRSIGGAFGVAVFGAIFNNRLAANLPKYLPPAALRPFTAEHLCQPRPARRAAAGHPPRLRACVQRLTPCRLPDRRAHRPACLRSHLVPERPALAGPRLSRRRRRNATRERT